jgi:tetratricopeptide (TPR) repeat protein
MMVNQLRLPIRVFVSHSSADDEFGVRLVQDLRQMLGSHDAVWYDSQGGLSGGDLWWSTIMQEIRTRNIFLVLLSPDAMTSPWVDAEITMAWRQMLSPNEASKHIIPVLYRSCNVRDDLQMLQIISFETPRSYQDAFAELQLALQMPDSTQSLILSRQIAVSSGTTPAAIYTVPFRHNPFFTGRESLLADLHQKLTEHRPLALTQPQAINGLGGIGKTQIAGEYAYRYREYYRYVFWLRAATAYDLLADFSTIAQLLDLPIKNEPDQRHIVAIVKRWLEQHTEWLLIFDNADDFAIVMDFLPQSHQGHILFTTRAQATGTFAQALPVDKMDLQEGVRFLLRRVKLLGPDTILSQITPQLRAEAEAIVREVNGLPLALDQVGAYIEETQYDLKDYLKLYRMRRKDLLRRRGNVPTDHPESVASTLALSFQKVEQINSAAADLLRVCAFLDPDAVPEELLRKGASQLGSELERIVLDAYLLNEAIEALLKYSLVKRNADKQTLSVHRLVQAVLRDAMDETTQLQWSERTVRAVAQALPEPDVIHTISWQLYLPQATICDALIQQYSFSFPEGAYLLNKTARFLIQRGFYPKAKELQERALALSKKALGPKHSDTMMIFNDLAASYWELGEYTEAERSYQQALTICEEIVGHRHPHTATVLNNLAILFDHQGKFDEAERLYKQALAICEEMLGSDHPDTATILNNLATLYTFHRRKERDAELFYQRVLAIHKKAFGPDHPDTATVLNNLAMLYGHQGKFADAETLHTRALAIRKERLGENHPDVAQTFHTLATLYYYQGKFTEAERLYQQSLTIYIEIVGERHAVTAMNMNNLAALYHTQRKYEDAEPLYRQALAIREETIGATHPDTASTLNNLALLCSQKGCYGEAELFCKRALAIYSGMPQALNSQTAACLNNLAVLYHVQEKYEEAEIFYKQAVLTYEKTSGNGHFDTLAARKNYATFLLQVNRPEEVVQVDASYGAGDTLPN